MALPGSHRRDQACHVRSRFGYWLCLLERSSLVTLGQHFRHSSFREKLIEHLFIRELLKLSWLQGDCSLEVAKPEVDNRGYDIVVERDGVVRHIQ